MKLDINAISSTVGRPSLLEDIALQYNVISHFCSAQYFVMFTMFLVKMSKRRSVAIVRKGNAKVIAQTSELTETPVRQRSYEKHEINWHKCFICQRDSTEKLQSSLEAQSTDPVKSYEVPGDRILKFKSLNALPVPMEVDE